ncbi:MAG: hypothetical protein ACYC7E_12300 [Armatimonadota bacterium]
MKIRIVSILLLALALTGAGYDAEMRALREQLGDGFTTRRAEMFLCAGNLSERQMGTIVEGTIGKGANALWKQYFRKRPDYPIRVYLFADETTYRTYAKQLFGDTNVSYFGYYKPDKRALVMNIGTGTGTLVHEMVHALMEPDFPQAPTWFSEGLASLYEQCYIEKDGLKGLVNWRLPVLRQGMRDKTTLPLARLIATDRTHFLDEHLGVHYAQARYFCLYLQEKGVLGKFYTAYRDGYAKDKTGAATLEKLLGKPLSKIEKDWLKWIGTLKG